jgi:fructose-bisphosphate aldolase class II
VALPAFCTENSWTTEAVLRAAVEAGRRHSLPDPPVAVGFTASYPGRSNLGNYTACGDLPVGFRAAMADLRALSALGGPYGRCRVLPHLDHGQPDRDRWLLEEHADEFAIVMFDAGALPMEQNMRRTADYVRRFGRRVVIEGAVAELKEAGTAEEVALTTPEQAERFLAETGCDLIVPNVGTEHRAAEEGRISYHGERGREIAAAVGPRLVLHGTSSMARDDLAAVPGDGFVKVNVWTAIERTGGAWLAERVLRGAGSMMDRPRLAELARAGLASEAALEGEGPELEHFALGPMRLGWVEEVAQMLAGYFDAFGYERLRGH